TRVIDALIAEVDGLQHRQQVEFLLDIDISVGLPGDHLQRSLIGGKLIVILFGSLWELGVDDKVLQRLPILEHDDGFALVLAHAAMRIRHDYCALPLQYIGSPHVADCSIFIFADAKPPGGPDRVRIGDADAFENEEWNERGDIRLDDLAFRILGLIYVRVDARQYPQRKTRFGNTTNVIGLTHDIAL